MNDWLNRCPNVVGFTWCVTVFFEGNHKHGSYCWPSICSRLYLRVLGIIFSTTGAPSVLTIHVLVLDAQRAVYLLLKSFITLSYPATDLLIVIRTHKIFLRNKGNHFSPYRTKSGSVRSVPYTSLTRYHRDSR